MSTPASSRADERRFVTQIRNHAELLRILKDLSLVSDTSAISSAAGDAAKCWLILAKEHLKDARAALDSSRNRSAYSRAYYAAYNASKAVRYYVNGVVSLKADDHRHASDLPDDFPDVARWTATIPELYGGRLRADYDNWRLTPSENTYTAKESFDLAQEFVQRCEEYLKGQHGVSI